MKTSATLVILITTWNLSLCQTFSDAFDNLDNWSAYSRGWHSDNTPCGNQGALPTSFSGAAYLNATFTFGDFGWVRQNDIIAKTYPFIANQAYRIKVRYLVQQTSNCENPLSEVFIHAADAVDLSKCTIPPLVNPERIYAQTVTGNSPYRDIDIVFTPTSNHSLISIYVHSHSCSVGPDAFSINSSFKFDSFQICEIPSKPVITSSTGYFTVCTGEPIILSAPIAAATQWSNGASSPSIEASSSGTYTVKLWNRALTCVSETSNPVSVIYSEQPRPTIIGNLTICPPITVTPLFTQTNYVAYKWSSGGTGTSIIAPIGTYTVSAFKQLTSGAKCWIKSLAATVKNGSSCPPPRGRIDTGDGIAESSSVDLDFEHADQLEVFPNPANNSVTIRLKYPAIVETNASIFDLRGVLVKKVFLAKGESVKIISIEDVTSGIYRISVPLKGTVQSKKLVVGNNQY